MAICSGWQDRLWNWKASRPVITVPAFKRFQDPLAVELGWLWNPAKLRYELGIGDHDTGGWGAQRNGEVGLEDLLDPCLLHDIEGNLALLGATPPRCAQAAPLIVSKPALQTIGKRFLIQSRPHHFTDRLMQIGCALQRIEQRRLIARWLSEQASMDYRKKLIVKPGAKVRLKDIDPAWHGQHENEAAAAKELAENVARLTDLQYLLYAEKKHSLLIVVQGIDAAGKDGTCWHVITAMNPQGTTVTSFKQPTAEELAHDFLWRVHPHVPGLGQVAVFNRSHYEDVLVGRVHNLVPESVWSKRYKEINQFEKLLARKGTTILKFFLYISPEEQLERFGKRLDDPSRQWKISESDYKERAYWDDYVKAYEAMLEQCSTD